MTDRPSAPPAISVVVPTFNRSSELPALVAALAAQDCGDLYEVLLVDDCSTDETGEVLARLIGEADGWMRALRTPSNSGPAVARNVGWRAARSPWVAFTDDDCLPTPGWLAALLAATTGASVVQGRTDPDPRGASSGPYARTISVSAQSFKFETCNIAYRRDLLEALGGFDERLGGPVPFGEDIDLGWRAVAHGATLGAATDALVFHRVATTGSVVRDWLGWIRYSQRCQFAALTVMLHPGLREHLHWRWFYKRYHVPTLLALLGLASARRSPAFGATLLVPWAYYRTFVERRAVPKEWHLPMLVPAFAVDVAEVLATVRGAVRYRTVLL